MARILVIDDDLNLLQMVRLMLERVGHEVETSHKGIEGIERATRNPPDLAIIDIMMPGLNGYDVVRRLREHPVTARVPILILTARSQLMDKQTALDAGANAFLSKPVSAQQLIERVEAVLQAGVDYRVHTGLLTEPIRPADAAGRASERAHPPAEADLIGAIAPRKNVIAVVSLRGGAGGTTLAVNLAMWEARRGRRASLIDLSPVGGHIPLHLHLATPQHWGALLGMRSAPDPAEVLPLLTVHPQSQVAVLAAPPAPTVDRLSAPVVQAMVRALSTHTARVVIDLPVLDAASAAALPLAGTVIVVLSDDACSVQTVQHLLGVLPALGVARERIGVVLCHVRPTAEIPVETIRKTLKQPLIAEIPYQVEQIAAIRRGVPLVIAEPNGAYAQAVSHLAQMFEQV